VIRRKFEKSFKAGRSTSRHPSSTVSCWSSSPWKLLPCARCGALGVLLSTTLSLSLARARAIASPPPREASRGSARSEEGGAMVRLLADQHEARFVDVRASGSVGEVRALFSLSSSIGFDSRARRVGSLRLCFSFCFAYYACTSFGIFRCRGHFFLKQMP
jgi:hypothetical protein